MNTNDLADYLVPLLRDMRPHRSSMTEAANLIERLRAERDEAQMEYADALIARDAAIRRAEVVTHNNGCWVCADEVGIVGAEHAGRCRDHSEQIESECAELTVERDAAIRRAEVAEADVVFWKSETGPRMIYSGTSPFVARLIRRVEAAEADAEKWRALDHDPRHVIQFSDDGWIIAHPLQERIDGSLFDCTINWTANDLGVRGRFYLNNDGTLGDAIGHRQ